MGFGRDFAGRTETFEFLHTGALVHLEPKW
jgi:hypothetical protein